MTQRGWMAAETLEAPQAVRSQVQGLARPLTELVARLNRRPPRFVMTCARGSSAHAAIFGKHLIERHLGIAVAAAAPSIATVYRRQLRLDGQLFLAISQSGRSDDLVEQTRNAKAAGALTCALLNSVDGPLADACDIVLPLGAGPEVSVAATKSFIASLSALLRLTAMWANDNTLTTALDRLPDRLTAASELDWRAVLRTLAGAVSLITIGRGPTLAIAREASLKLKETCNLHAEAFSAAEFLHGPVALVSTQYPLLLFTPMDEARESVRQLAANLRKKGANVFIAEPGMACAGRLPVLPADHAEVDAVCLIQSFYVMALRLAELLGTDVDRPRHLEKVTKTL